MFLTASNLITYRYAWRLISSPSAKVFICSKEILATVPNETRPLSQKSASESSTCIALRVFLNKREGPHMKWHRCGRKKVQLLFHTSWKINQEVNTHINHCTHSLLHYQEYSILRKPTFLKPICPGLYLWQDCYTSKPKTPFSLPRSYNECARSCTHGWIPWSMV
jgi:hypothetical protein